MLETCEKKEIRSERRGVRKKEKGPSQMEDLHFDKKSRSISFSLRREIFLPLPPSQCFFFLPFRSFSFSLPFLFSLSFLFSLFSFLLSLFLSLCFFFSFSLSFLPYQTRITVKHLILSVFSAPFLLPSSHSPIHFLYHVFFLLHYAGLASSKKFFHRSTSCFRSRVKLLKKNLSR